MQLHLQDGEAAQRQRSGKSQERREVWQAKGQIFEIMSHYVYDLDKREVRFYGTELECIEWINDHSGDFEIRGNY